MDLSSSAVATTLPRPVQRGGGSLWERFVLLALLSMAPALGSCASESDRAAAEAGSGADVSPQEQQLETFMQMLSVSWMQQAAADPGKVAELVDSPGGEGWLRLFHGDLVAARQIFEAAQPELDPGNKGAARLGLARVHLAQARLLLKADLLQREAAAALARYRIDNRAALRSGKLGGLLSKLALQAAGEGNSPLAQAGAAGGVEAGALADLLAVRAAGAAAMVEGLPEPFASRLSFGAAMAEGDLASAEPLLASLQLGEADLREDLGADVEAGVRFQALYFDAALNRALARYHLARAWFYGAGLDGPGELIAVAVLANWGGELPAQLRNAAMPAAGSQPAWLAQFLGPSIDRDDWDSYWGVSQGGRPFLQLLQDQQPQVPWLDATSTEQVDAVLRAASGLEGLLSKVLTQSVGSEGASLAQDLGFSTTVLDRILRTRVVALVEAGQAVAAKRLAERSLDAEPTRLGGAANSAATRVSFRNDRAFLIELAWVLWRAGQVDAALSYVHPLSEENPQLRGLAYYLGQLAAAKSIRIQGKAAQQ